MFKIIIMHLFYSFLLIKYNDSVEFSKYYQNVSFLENSFFKYRTLIEKQAKTSILKTSIKITLYERFN